MTKAEIATLRDRVAELEAELCAWEIGEEYQACVDAYDIARAGESAALKRVAEYEREYGQSRLRGLLAGVEQCRTGETGFDGANRKYTVYTIPDDMARRVREAARGGKE